MKQEQGNHLTDEQIQEYIGIDINTIDSSKHLRQCDKCRLKLTEYESLCASLANETIPELSDNFANSVMTEINSITVAETSPEKKSDFTMVFGLVGALVGLVLTAVFFDLEKLLGLARLDRWITGVDSWTSKMIISFNSHMPFDIELLFAAVMVLAVIKLVDYVIQHNRRQKLATFVV